VEFLMNHLRLREGFAASVFNARTGLKLAALEPGLSECIEAGLLEWHGDTIRSTETGWNFLDTVLEKFLV
jgi:oxygen-independent coproporphyrinogen-3 oxidase